MERAPVERHQALPAWQAPAGPATAGQGREPRSGGAARASLDGMAPVRPAWLQAEQGLLFRSQPEPALSAQAPFDAAVIAHEAGDVLPDALVEDGLPRHEAEAETTITAEALDHREPAAG